MKKNVTSVALILTCAGSSTRFHTGKKKEYLPLISKHLSNETNGTVLSCSIIAFLQFFSAHKDFLFTNLVITVPNENYEQECKKALLALNASNYVKTNLEQLKPTISFVAGSTTRQKSVYNGLQHLDNAIKNNAAIDIVLIHDAARPFVDKQIIHDVLYMVQKKDAAVPIIEPVDTQKEIGTDGSIVRHLNRSALGAVQTPQGFLFEKLFMAHKKAAGDSKSYTDDAEIWATYCDAVYTVKGNTENTKITFSHDMESKMENKLFRTGLGTDTHRLVENRPLIIGGIVIPFEKGEEAHSDGDVLLHAITDCLLGAAGIGDIGELFPPSDNKWQDANSALLLKSAWEMVLKKGWRLENLDCVIALEKPKFLPWRKKVIESIATILQCDSERIFVKAKTAEGLGEIGASLAVGAQAICLLSK